MRRNAVALLGFAPMLVLLTALPATGAELISIPVERVIYGDEGDEVFVAGADVPTDLVGLSCEMSGETVNQRSVHPGNDLLIRLGAQTRVLADFENESDIRHTFREIAELPQRIEVFVRLGPAGVSSGGFLISIQCETQVTTTTEGPATTTVPTETTIIAPPTSTGPSTTTVPSTTVPGETSSTTIVVDGPTSQAPTTQAPPASITQQTPPPAELAVTGPGSVSLVALVLLGVGCIGVGVLTLARLQRF